MTNALVPVVPDFNQVSWWKLMHVNVVQKAVLKDGQ